MAKAEGKENSVKKGEIAPRCQHFGTCGGCQLQHFKYEDQLKWKFGRVQEVLAEVVPGKAWEPIKGCDNPWEYRNKLELSFGREEDGGWRLGFHLPKRRYDVFELEECFLMAPYAAFIAGRIRDFMLSREVSVFHFRANEGFLRSLYVREGKHTGELMVNLVGSGERFDFESQLRDLVVTESEKFLAGKKSASGKRSATGKRSAAGKPVQLTSFYLTRMVAKKGQRTRQEEKLLYGKPVIREQLIVDGQTLNFNISPVSFFQPNTFQAEKLYETVLDFAGLTGQEVVYDLFCGTGTIGLSLAPRARKVYGVELEKKAVENAVENARRNRISNAEFEAGDVGSRVMAIPDEPDVMVMDPPRAGVAKKTLLKIMELESPRMVYVSCNPESLARDLGLLAENGYAVEKAQAVDMFPQTRHVECVVKVARSA